MGEFFISATEDDAVGDLPDAVEAPGIGEAGLIALGVIVGAGHPDELLRELERTRDPAVGDADVVRLPRKLRDRLSETENLADVARRWSESDDLEADEWDPEDVLELVERVTLLAREARETGIDLWYRWSPSSEG